MEVKNSILIIDDEKSNLLYLNQILGKDYNIYTARNAYEGLQRTNQYNPDLILLDVIMPGMDGYEALVELKKSEKTRTIPVVFITGLSSKDDEEKGLNLGAEDYITKPFSDAIVKLRVQNQIKIKNQNQLIISKGIAERSSRAKAEFLSRMSHEMRTPMNAILGMTAMAQNTDDPEKRKNYLKKAENASRELMRLIDDVLEISNIEENKFKLYEKEFNFRDMLGNIFENSNPGFMEKHQKFTVKIDPSIPELIIGDEKRLSQIIENLLSNAHKFTEENGSIGFNAFVHSKDKDYMTMQIEVSDNGIGIPEEDHDRIFAAFEQFDGSTNRKYNGAGLGLFISKNLITLMGGKIWTEPNKNEGSKFIFTFKSKIPVKDTINSVSLSGKTALLAEDVEINREIVLSMLEDTQLKIICAENGREALEIISAGNERIDIIFMDINMPEMDGIEATRRIREMNLYKQIPIIAMTANVLPDEIQKYLEAGMSDHIGKPIDFDLLLKKINTCLNR